MSDRSRLNLSRREVLALSGASFLGLMTTSCAADQHGDGAPQNLSPTFREPSAVSADLAPMNSFGRMLAVADAAEGYLIPALTDAVNGDYILAYRAGKAHALAYGSDPGKLYVRRSNDAGRTFDPPTLVAAFVNEQLDIRDPYLYRDPGSARIWLTFFTGARNLSGTTWITYSDDHGLTWAPSRKITTVGLTPGGLRRSPDGIWRMPVYRRAGGFWRASLVTAKNPYGEWSTPVDVLAPPRSDATEWDFAEVSPTNWVAVVRGSAHVNAYVTQSRDKGRTWAAPVELPSPRPGLRYDAWPALRIAHDGRVLCFIRGAEGGQRLVQLFEAAEPLVPSNWSERDGGGLLASGTRGTCGKFQPFRRGTAWVGSYYAETDGKRAAEIGIGTYDESTLRARSSTAVVAAPGPVTAPRS